MITPARPGWAQAPGGPLPLPKGAVRVAAAQFAATTDRADNLARIARFAEQAARAGR